MFFPSLRNSFKTVCKKSSSYIAYETGCLAHNFPEVCKTFSVSRKIFSVVRGYFTEECNKLSALWENFSEGWEGNSEVRENYSLLILIFSHNKNYMPAHSIIPRAQTKVAEWGRNFVGGLEKYPEIYKVSLGDVQALRSLLNDFVGLIDKFHSEERRSGNGARSTGVLSLKMRRFAGSNNTI